MNEPHIMKKRPTCQNKGCNNPCNIMGTVRKADGVVKTYFRKICSACHASNKPTYHKHKKKYCENRDGRLGFKCRYVLQGSYQLDVDHINGNHDDNRPKNLQTLCANCHRYKSRMNGDSCRNSKHLKGKIRLTVDSYLRTRRVEWVTHMTNSFGLDREYDNLVNLYEKHVGKVTASLTSEDMVKAMIPHWNEEAKTMDRASLKECITQFREYWREMTEGEDE